MPTNKPSAEQLRLARAQAARMADAIDAGRIRPGFRHIESDTIRTLLAATDPDAAVNDPRPSDPAELARMTTVELRKRGICAIDNHGEVHFPRPERAFSGMPTLRYGCALLCRDVFEDLGPIACANVIIAEEAARLRGVFAE